MVCPQCHQTLTDKEIITSDNQNALVYECFNCGGHFIPPLIANLIPPVTTQNLDSITPKNTYPSNPTITCPICQETMSSITDDVVPNNVTVYTCGQNHGNFFPLHQLYAFKRAQKTKLEYHQLWGIPIKSVFSVLLPILAIFTAISAIPLAVDQLKTSQENRVKAGELTSNPLISPISPNQVVISFTTKIPSTSSLKLRLSGGIWIFPGAVNPQTTHIFNLENLKPATPYQYELIVNDKSAGTFSFTTPGL
ncbi:zf-TFIIB domain-containing protein [Candidatus Collierbacteria bacterium]|nr:zf-TFIIB domain-containing protein [Candidatus Collierbacteria bacterium]